MARPEELGLQNYEGKELHTFFPTPWPCRHHRQILTSTKVRELKPGPCARHRGPWKLPNDYAKVSIVVLL